MRVFVPSDSDWFGLWCPGPDEKNPGGRGADDPGEAAESGPTQTLPGAQQGERQLFTKERFSVRGPFPTPLPNLGFPLNDQRE